MSILTGRRNGFECRPNDQDHILASKKIGFYHKLLLLSVAGAVSCAAGGSIPEEGLDLPSLAAGLFGLKAFGRDRTPGSWDQAIIPEQQETRYL